jgi:hypothetical protein
MLKTMFCKKDLAGSKKVRTFAPSSEKTILWLLGCVAVFFATNTALYAAEIRLSIFNGCCASKPVIVFSEMKKDSLSSFKYFNFSFMEKTMKDYNNAKHSNVRVTPDCESVQNNNLLPKSEQNTQDLGNVDSSTVIGNNANDSKISSVRIGHSTDGENSPVEGHIFSQTNHVDTSTGITVISGTGHTINVYVYQYPKELSELLIKLIKLIN